MLQNRQLRFFNDILRKKKRRVRDQERARVRGLRARKRKEGKKEETKGKQIRKDLNTYPSDYSLWVLFGYHERILT